MFILVGLKYTRNKSILFSEPVPAVHLQPVLITANAPHRNIDLV